MTRLDSRDRRDGAADAPDAALEALISSALTRLPTPLAPPTLLARVLAEVGRTAARPWYSRAWVTWPRVWQLASVAAFVILLAGAIAIAPRAQSALPPVGASVARIAIAPPSFVTRGVSAIRAWSDAAHALERICVTVFAPYAPYLALFLIVMFAACLVLWTLLDRVALGGAVES